MSNLLTSLSGVPIDNQTVLTVQSLLESQGITNGVAVDSELASTPVHSGVALDEDDVFQCGKCKKQFTSISLFMSHKKEHISSSAETRSRSGFLKQEQLNLPLEESINSRHQNTHHSPSETNAQTSFHVQTLEADLNESDLCQPIILGDSDILSFSVDQGALSLTSPQIISSMALSNDSFLTPGTNESKSISDNGSPSDSYNLTLNGQSIIFASSQLPEGTFVTSLPNIESVVSQNKMPSSLTINSNNCKNADSDNVDVVTYPNKVQRTKSCKLILPNINFINRPSGEREILLNYQSENKENGKEIEFDPDLNGGRTLLLDYTNLDPAKNCKVLLQNGEFSETSIEYIDSSVEFSNDVGSTETIVGYPNLDICEGLSGIEQGITVSLLDVVQNTEEDKSTSADAEENLTATDSFLPPSKQLKLKCEFCEKKFAKNFDLQQHMRSHTGEKPFQCVVCGRAFSQKSNVKKHMETHKVWPNGLSRTLPKEPIQVLAKDKEPSPTEPQSSDKSPQDNQDAAIVVLENSYACQYCSNIFSSYCELKTHMKEHANEKVYKCIQKKCHKTFSDLDSFLEHTNGHMNAAQYRCHVCCKQFTTLEELGVHQYSHSSSKKSSMRQGARGFTCTKCKSKFSSPEALEHHLSTTNHHFPCSQCGRVFACERYLRRHLPTHQTAEIFKCNQCGKGFRTEQYLNTHKLVHSVEKPFTCQHCPAAFNRKDKLQRHSLIHQAVKRFKCPFNKYLGCSREFNRQDKLKLHILTHTSVKPITCRVCSKAFYRPALLKEHEKLHHQETNSFAKCMKCEMEFASATDIASHVCSSTNEKDVGIKNRSESSKYLYNNSSKKSKRTQLRKNNQRRSRINRFSSVSNKKSQRLKKACVEGSICKPDKSNSNANSLKDNVPTIEIIVMPVSVDQTEESINEKISGIDSSKPELDETEKANENLSCVYDDVIYMSHHC